MPQQTIKSRKTEAKYFFRTGLDSGLNVESASEFRFFAHAIRHGLKALQRDLLSISLPDGQIELCRRQIPTEAITRHRALRRGWIDSSC